MPSCAFDCRHSPSGRPLTRPAHWSQVGCSDPVVDSRAGIGAIRRFRCPDGRAGACQSQPMAPDLSLDPEWCLYGFRRDGISCYQVNDLAGRVHIVVGNADETLWVLLAGESTAKVLLLT